jgi:hypothetical protein
VNSMAVQYEVTRITRHSFLKEKCIPAHAGSAQLKVERKQGLLALSYRWIYP